MAGKRPWSFRNRTDALKTWPTCGSASTAPSNALELPRLRIHDLRHTAASHLLTKHVHPKVAQELLGHSTIAVILDTYSQCASRAGFRSHQAHVESCA